MERKKPIKRSKPPKQKTPLKRGAPPKKRSKKMEALYEKRRPFVKRILSERPYCEACVVFAKHDGKATFIKRRSVDVHELVRRSQGGSILDDENVLAVCRPCHTRIGNNPQLAFDLDLAKQSWKK
jgi:hypothetical protein